MKIFDYEIPDDKAQHALYWILGTLFIAFLFGTRAASISALGAGILKEVYDKFWGSGKFDTLDLLADVIGIITALILCRILF